MARGQRGIPFSKPLQQFRPHGGPAAGATPRPGRASPHVDEAPEPLRMVPDWEGTRSSRSEYAPVVELLDGETTTYVHPYAGVPRGQWRRRARELHETFPIPEQLLIETIQTELRRIMATFHHQGEILGRPVSMEDLPSFKTTVHDWIAKAIGDLPGFRYGALSKGEKDVPCPGVPGNGIEVKTVKGGDIIIGNKSSSVRRPPGAKPKKAQDSWYVAVSWDPGDPVNGARVERIAVGYLSPEDFDVRTHDADGKKVTSQQRSSVPFDHKKLIDIHVSDVEETRLRERGKSVKARIRARHRAAAAAA